MPTIFVHRFAVRLPEADDQSGRCHPESIPLVLRTQALQEEHGITVDIVRIERGQQRRHRLFGSRRCGRLPQLPRVLINGQLGPPESRRNAHLFGAQVRNTIDFWLV